MGKTKNNYSKKKKDNSTAIALIIVGVSILVIGAAWMLLGNQPSTQPVNVGEPIRVTLADAKIAFDNGNAVFIDTRSLVSYGQNHIVNAISFPEEDIANRINELNKDDWIIPYCT
ncbi:MAG: hypothetical protein JEZ06_12720 [Anaerolineaceae bacterium]|nr:hypothetical protein [Anaerolineaceae bacterium]